MPRSCGTCSGLKQDFKFTVDHNFKFTVDHNQKAEKVHRTDSGAPIASSLRMSSGSVTPLAALKLAPPLPGRSVTVKSQASPSNPLAALARRRHLSAPMWGVWISSGIIGKGFRGVRCLDVAADASALGDGVARVGEY